MSHEEFEKHIRDTLAGHQTNLDTGAFWNQLEAKRRRRRRLFFFWLPAGLLLFGSGMIAWWVLAMTAPSVIPETANTLSETTIASDLYSAPNSGLDADGLATATETSQTNDISLESRPNPVAMESAANLTDSQLFYPKEELATVADIPSSVGSQISDRDPITTIPTQAKDQSDQTTAAATEGSRLLSGVYCLSFSPQHDAGLPDMPAAVLLDDVPSRRRSNWTVQLGLTGGIGLPFRFLRSPDGSSPYSDLRTNTEIPLEVLTGQLDFLATHRSGWGVRTGLEFRQFADRLDFRDTIFNQFEDSLMLLRVIEYPDGSREEEYGPGIVTETGIRNVVHYNYTRFMAVPVVGQYRFSGSGRWGGFVEAGASLTIWKKATGRILNESGEPVSIDASGAISPYLRPGLSMEFLLGGGISWQFSDLFTLDCYPEVRYRPGNLYSTEYPLELRTATVGLRLGLRWKLK